MFLFTTACLIEPKQPRTSWYLNVYILCKSQDLLGFDWLVVMCCLHYSPCVHLRSFSDDEIVEVTPDLGIQIVNCLLVLVYCKTISLEKYLLCHDFNIISVWHCLSTWTHCTCIAVNQVLGKAVPEDPALSSMHYCITPLLIHAHTLCKSICVLTYMCVTAAQEDIGPAPPKTMQLSSKE